MTGASTADRQTTIERWNTVLRALAAEPRRQLVASLMDAPPDRELSLPEAANPPSLLTERESLYSELIHSHLPMLADADLIEWERKPLCARRGPKFDEAAAIVRSVHECDDDLPPTLREKYQPFEGEYGKQNL